MAVRAKIAPRSRTTHPTQSPVDHRGTPLSRAVARPGREQRRKHECCGDHHQLRADDRRERRREIAPPIHRRLRVTNALAMTKKHSAAYGYAIGSSTTIGRVRERRDRACTGGREERRRLSDHHPREEVRREDDRCHDQDVDILDRRIGGRHVVDAPERRDQVRDPPSRRSGARRAPPDARWRRPSARAV